MFPRLFKYAAKNILRNTFLSVSSVLILTLLMFFINILIVIHDVSFRIIDGINEKLTISLYLDEDYNKNSIEVIDLQSDIKKAIPEIGIRYKTKEEAFAEMKKADPELVQILDRQNPLPETIRLDDIPLEKYKLLNTIIENKLFILTESQDQKEKNSWDKYFSTYTKQFERIEKIIDILTALQIGLYIIIVTFVVSIAVIVYSIIGNFIYYYRDEIYITRLVWWSKVFIYGPFSLQGMMYVATAFICSTTLFILLLNNLQYVFDISDFSSIYRGDLTLILGLEWLLFLWVWGLSGFLSSRKYLKK